MSILSTLRDRFSTRESSAVQSSEASEAQREPVAEARLPFAGYDGLDARQVTEGLSDRSQIELEAVEGYERSHKSRDSVLDKLRWMRGEGEPLPGYDALSVEEIVTVLERADLATIQKVRAYERKFGNRREVLEDVARVNHLRLAKRPANATPAYQPTSYQPTSETSVGTGRGDRMEKSGRP